MEQSTPLVNDLAARVTHGYADNQGMKLHYAMLGEGPLMVLLHGFPDFWYSWRYQMPALAQQYQVVAPDLRGYNLSDKPAGGEQYRMRHLVSDVAAIVQHLGQQRAIIVGHDWGGAIAWQVAQHLPQLVDRLIILNVPHPRGLARELAHNPEQQENSAYARRFQEDGAEQLSPERLLNWLSDRSADDQYLDAYRRSDFSAMLHYYKQNYPREPYADSTPPLDKIKAPTLIIHGLDDTALLASGHNNTWEWIDNELTLVMVPHAGHFVQHDAAELVTRTIKRWLA